MSLIDNQFLNLALGALVLLGGGYYAISKNQSRQKIKQTQQIYQTALKCNLNNLNIQKQKKFIQNAQNYFHNRLVSIQNVMAHFPQGKFSYANIIQGKYDDFSRVQSESFKIVQRKNDPNLYSLYGVKVKDTLVGQTVLMPDIIFRNPNVFSNEHKQEAAYTRLITSATTLGIIGVLKFDSDNLSWAIDAKFIGCNLQEIGKFIEGQKFYNSFGIFLGCVLVAAGMGFIIKTVLDNRKSRVPLQFSLLNSSAKKKN